MTFGTQLASSAADFGRDLGRDFSPEFSSDHSSDFSPLSEPPLFSSMTTTSSARKIAVRRSSIHGKGVYAIRLIRQGERVVEYKGEQIDWEEALRRHPHDPAQPHHTFYFALEDGHVIDGKSQGNSAKWINHSCNPNCEATMVVGKNGQRVFIEALRDIAAGEELFYDYGLVIDERHTKKLKAEHACWCGSKTCRGTMLARKK